jgi:hypothetical protein
MSIESLCSEIDLSLAGINVDRSVGYAALNDFVRVLHEVFTKSGRDQLDLLSQVQTTLGSAPSHHLARVINADHFLPLRSYPENKCCPLLDQVIKICNERGMDLNDGRSLFSHLLKVFDEERFEEGKCSSILLMAYYSVGSEAAYHIGGLYAGDDAQMISDEIEYLDRRLKRFRTYIDRWDMELAWDREDEI